MFAHALVQQSTLTERFVSNCSGRNSSFSSVVSVGGTGPVRETATGSVSTTSSVNSAVVNAASATATAGGSIGSTAGEPTHGPLTGAGGSLFKYVVYKQPLSLDRFYIHDVLPTTEGASKYSFFTISFV